MSSTLVFFRRRCAAVCVGCAAGSVLGLYAADTADLPADAAVFRLGTVAVYGAPLSGAEQVPVQIDAATTDLLEKKDLSGALSQLPGVTLTRFGGRNETAVYVRGFARNQVPLFIDGIPVYVPYDGIIDLGRFTTYDVGAISVAKGYSSALYGPNTMGGVINISTRQPTRAFEGQLTAGVFSGEGWETALNLGGKRGHWYYQAGVSYVDQQYYPLSAHFAPVPAEDGGRRENSYRTDWKVSAKLAYTPNATDEYAIGFVHQEGEKGNPPQTTAPKYWRWPMWDKETIYLIANTRLGDSSYLKPRLYYDTYDNSLGIYDDAAYTTQNKPSSGTSIYNEYSYGGSLEFGTEALARNFLKAIVHYKLDQHKEHPDLARRPTTFFVDRDASLSYALEDTLELTGAWDLQLGLSYDTRETKKAVDTSNGNPFPPTDFESLNPLGGLFYKLGATDTLHLTVAKKSRFPSMKERYSYRMGSGIPNADLDAESAVHYEFGYVGRPTASLTVNAALYYSRVSDTIQQVYLSPTSTVSQFQNIGTSEKRGLDLGAEWKPSTGVTLGLSYGTIHQKTLTTLPKNTEPVKATDVPGQSGSLYAELRPLDWLAVVPSLDFASWRYSFSDGKGGERKLPGFATAGLKLTARLPHGLAASVGVGNLLDRSYALQEGYPEAGRNWYANVRYTF